jgi:hypothetical protein
VAAVPWLVQLVLELKLELLLELEQQLELQLVLELEQQLELQLVLELEQQLELQLVLELEQQLELQATASLLAVSEIDGMPAPGRHPSWSRALDRVSGKLRLRTLRMFQRLKPRIEFVCDPSDRGIIAEPIPAKQVLPDWFRRLPPVTRHEVSSSNNGLTVKRCMPFLDALTTGWILPLAATVRLEIKDGGRRVDAGWEFDKVLVSNHGSHQVAGNPLEPRPPCKFHNYWTIKTPAGWSCLFVHPLNRHGSPVEIMAGIVDTDSYQSLIHFPFVATAPDGVYTLERGAPLVQVIPFRRDATYIAAEIRSERAAETQTRHRILRHTLAEEGWYRRMARAKR